MKKIISMVLLGITAALLFGCTPSTIEESTIEHPDGIILPENFRGEMTLPETSAYVIPEDAETGEYGGPGAMATTAVDYSYYPEDKQPVEVTVTGTQVIIYVPGPNGITASFDFVDTCDAESLIDVMINNNALTDEVAVESFEIAEDGRSAVLDITEAQSVYAAASEEEVVTAIANTFIDNFSLDEISVNVSGTGNDYENLGFSQEYDAKKQNKESTEAAE